MFKLRHGKMFFCFPEPSRLDLETTETLTQKLPGIFPGKCVDRGEVDQNSVPRKRISGTLYFNSPYAFLAWTGASLPFIYMRMGHT
jgi:hypothetical protein